MKSAGILVLSNLKNIKDAMNIVKKYVSNLYIHLNIPNDGVKVQVPQWNSIITKIYSDTSNYDSSIDVRVLVNPLKNIQVNPNLKNVKHIFCDGKFPELCDYLKQSYSIDKSEVIFGDERNSYFEFDDNRCDGDVVQMHDVVVLGGTFDRIHVGHKIFLTEAVLRSCKKIVVGVTDEKMIENKILSELILPTERRIKDVKNFLSEIDCTLQYEIVAISDPFGPTKLDPNMDMIAVSEETYRGGVKVNEIRRQNHLKELKIHTIKLIETEDCENKNHPKELKISSSNCRMDLLGTLLKQPKLTSDLPTQPYIVGLTGNIGSGKSVMAKRFIEMGAHIIDCDKVAHEVYEPGKPAYLKIINTFGQDIIGCDKKIDRKKLGTIVFGDFKKLEILNQIVWPAILEEVKTRIKKMSNMKVVILEAAVLFKAGWETECHEVWSMVIPRDVAIKRIKERNNLSEDEAAKRIDSQLTNKEIVQKSNVIFSSQWSYEFTEYQAQKAWKELQERIHKINS